MKAQTKTTIKDALKFTACILPIAIIAGLAVSYYEIESGIAEGVLMGSSITKGQFILIATSQTIFYGLVCGFFGYILSKKIGLLREFRFHKRETLTAIISGAVCGVLFFVLDGVLFTKLIPAVGADYENYSFSIATIGAKILYGGIMEETIMRFFLMSLVALILWKISQLGRRGSSQKVASGNPQANPQGVAISDLRGSSQSEKAAKVVAPTWALVASNILVAMVFAAGHLPATVSLFGGLTAIIVIRCFVLNGMFGLVFGWLYRKYGIQYSMIGHAMTHVACMISVFLVL